MRLIRSIVRWLSSAGLLLLLLWGAVSALAAIEIDADRLGRLARTQYGAQGEKRMTDWLALVRSRPTADDDRLLQLANDFWNRSLQSAEDQVLWGQADYWATPLESLGRGAGDCEDYVIGKYFTLLGMGVAPEKLRFIYVRARLGGPASSVQVAHMVLGYYRTPDAQPLVLDSLLGTILPASQRRDLAPVFSFNAEGVYVDGKSAAPADRLSRWRDLLQRMAREGIKP